MASLPSSPTLAPTAKGTGTLLVAEREDARGRCVDPPSHRAYRAPSRYTTIGNVTVVAQSQG